MEISAEILAAILDGYPYEVVFADRNHVIRYMNQAAKRRYGDSIGPGHNLADCFHSPGPLVKINEFLRRADVGEQGEMFENLNNSTGEREFFVPVRVGGEVIGYFERHEVPWETERVNEPVGDYWLRSAK